MWSLCIDPEAGCIWWPGEKVTNASGPLTGHFHARAGRVQTCLTSPPSGSCSATITNWYAAELISILDGVGGIAVVAEAADADAALKAVEFKSP